MALLFFEVINQKRKHLVENVSHYLLPLLLVLDVFAHSLLIRPWIFFSPSCFLSSSIILCLFSMIFSLDALSLSFTCLRLTFRGGISGIGGWSYAKFDVLNACVYFSSAHNDEEFAEHINCAFKTTNMENKRTQSDDFVCVWIFPIWSKFPISWLFALSPPSALNWVEEQAHTLSNSLSLSLFLLSPFNISSLFSFFSLYHFLTLLKAYSLNERLEKWLHSVCCLLQR